jgi:hypothetical protein
MRYVTLIVLATASLNANLAEHAGASVYTFNLVADTTTAAPNGSFTSFSLPAISGDTVAFRGFYSGGQGVFTGSGGPLTTIAKTGDAAPAGAFTGFTNPTISGNTVAFIGSYSGARAIFADNGGARITIVKTGDAAPFGTFSNFGNSSVSGNTVAFSGFYGSTGRGIFTGNGGPITTVGSSTNVGEPALSGSTAAYWAFFGNEGIFTGSGGPQTRIVGSGDPAPLGNFVSFNSAVSISGSTVAFQGNFSGGRGIFTGNGGALQAIAKTGDAAPVGTFNNFDAPAISGSIAAFKGYYNNGVSGGLGIFIGSGGQLDTVIKTGDSLFGSTVSSLFFDRFGLDADGSGDLAFFYQLANGNSGIAIASPAAIPEASSFVIWTALAAIGLNRKSFGSLYAGARRRSIRR